MTPSPSFPVLVRLTVRRPTSEIWRCRQHRHFEWRGLPGRAAKCRCALPRVIRSWQDLKRDLSRDETMRMPSFRPVISRGY
jgi:hypothetical protein